MRRALIALTAVIAAALILFVACGGGGTISTGSRSLASNVTVMVSDPTTCSAPQGPYSHVYVTITDVQASTNANAPDGDSSFVDLTPSLKNAPVQVDLLGIANNSCFLASLGAAASINPGNYQQIRVILLDNSASKPSGNKCGNDANCVVTAADGVAHTLNLSSESKTGIKIPSSQISTSGFNATSGGNQTLDIDFDACASIVVQGNGQYRLKPVLHAGEVSTTASTSISGKVIDNVTKGLIAGGKTIVTLQQKDAGGVDRIVFQTTPDSTGAFVFCPVPAGTYDIVVAAVNNSNVMYAATILTGVQQGSSVGNIPMNPQTGTSTAPASLTGTVTSAGTAGPVAADVALTALGQVTIGTATTPTSITIPLVQQSSASGFSAIATVITAPTSGSLTCAAGVDCAQYTLSVPAVAPTVATFSTSTFTYTAGTGAASYVVSGHAYITGSGAKDNCTNPVVNSTSVTTTAGANTAVPTLAFSGCTAGS